MKCVEPARSMAARSHSMRSRPRRSARVDVHRCGSRHPSARPGRRRPGRSPGACARGSPRRRWRRSTRPRRRRSAAGCPCAPPRSCRVAAAHHGDAVGALDLAQRGDHRVLERALVDSCTRWRAPRCRCRTGTRGPRSVSCLRSTVAFSMMPLCTTAIAPSSVERADARCAPSAGRAWPSACARCRPCRRPGSPTTPARGSRSCRPPADVDAFSPL
jgi:hypothetical protein